MFTTRKVAAGEFLDASPVLFLSADDGDHIMATPLRNYIFEIDDRYALACGPASFLNHSYAPNAEYVIDLDASILELLALEPIPAGSEVLINYNGSPNDHAPLWFDLAQE
ncbi:MAG: SET domain-containing protein-lysine N-methyltransferase [Acidimicrobiia bacterium]